LSTSGICTTCFARIKERVYSAVGGERVYCPKGQAAPPAVVAWRAPWRAAGAAGRTHRAGRSLAAMASSSCTTSSPPLRESAASRWSTHTPSSAWYPSCPPRPTSCGMASRGQPSTGGGGGGGPSPRCCGLQVGGSRPPGAGWPSPAYTVPGPEWPDAAGRLPDSATGLRTVGVSAPGGGGPGPSLVPSRGLPCPHLPCLPCRG
jgi:hypothetical protein